MASFTSKDIGNYVGLYILPASVSKGLGMTTKCNTLSWNQGISAVSLYQLDVGPTPKKRGLRLGAIEIPLTVATSDTKSCWGLPDSNPLS